MTSCIRVTQVEEKDFGLLLSCHNHPCLRRFMYTQHEIALDIHRAWYPRISIKQIAYAYFEAVNLMENIPNVARLLKGEFVQPVYKVR